MAEIGLAASIIGIVGAGIKLSIATFDFASSIGSAGKELQNVATEISDLCAVLKHLQALLENAHFRPSLAAIKDLQRIVNHCSAVFQEIDQVISGLRSSRGDELFPSATPDFINKVKWTFKKSKVQMQRSTLDACKSTLSLMLNTMMLAESMSRRRLSSAKVTEDEHDRAMTQSLVIAQQCAVEKLELLEDEVEKEEETARLLPGVTATPSRPNIKHRRKSRNRLVGMFSGLSVITDLPTPTTTPIQPPGRFERASIWLDSIVAASDAAPHPGIRKQKRLSSAGTANAPTQLLQRWTQPAEEPYIDPVIASTHDLADTPSVIWHDQQFSFVTSTDETEPEIGVSRASTGLTSPKTARAKSVSFCQAVEVKGALEATQALRSYHDIEDANDAIVDQILRDFDTAVSSDVDLFLCFGGKTRMLKPNEAPLETLQHHEDLDLDPRLFVRRRKA